MIAQYAVELCAQSLYSAAALVVEEMGAKFNCDATQRVERMTKKQKLAFRVNPT